MKYFTLLLITGLFINFSAAQIIKTKDGVSLGTRNDFISGCIKGADKEMINIKGMKIKTHKYCSCVCDNLIPSLYSNEIETALKNNRIMDLFLNDENLAIVMSCMEGNVKIEEGFKIDDNYKINDTNYTETVQKVAIKTCVDKILNNRDNKGFLWSQTMAESYCSCAISKLFSMGYNYKSISELYDINSETYNEVVIPCVNEAQNNINSTTSNSDTVNDILGADSTSVPLLDYLKYGYKVKISIDSISNYYLFDTGASDLIISPDIERKLIIKGSIEKSDYIGSTYYALANNQKVKAKLVKLNNVKIGDYVVNNVVVAVFDNASLLCGKSFLDKFKKWEINKEKKILILYK